MTKNKEKLIVRIALLVLVCIVIFWFSSNNGESSTSQSDRIVDILIETFFPSYDKYSYESQLAIHDMFAVAVRKGAHFSIYAIMGAVGFAAFFKIKKYSLRYLCAVAFTFLYACTDEFHQTFVSERTGKISDIFIDTFGGMLGAFLIMLFIVFLGAAKLVQKEKQNNHSDT